MPPEDLNQVDGLMRFLDLPFNPDKWTRLYTVHGAHTLTHYFALLADDKYDDVTWKDESERWRKEREAGTLDENIQVLSDAEMRALYKKWSDAYTPDELRFLEDYYNQIVATQNVSTPIYKHYAQDLCELELVIKKGLRGGQDVKKEMDARDNIIKVANFTASNAKNSADFESVGELMVYYGKKGWHPKWHSEPQDSIDFLMRDTQNYARRLIMNEGNIYDQVEDKRARINMAERLENEDDLEIKFASLSEEPTEFEGEDDLAGELSDWTN